MKHLLYCPSCRKYTLKDVCSCGTKTESRKPAKYSPEDRLAKYRRMALSEERREQGIL